MKFRRRGSFELSEFTSSRSKRVQKITVCQGSRRKLETAVLSSTKGVCVSTDPNRSVRLSRAASQVERALVCVSRVHSESKVPFLSRDQRDETQFRTWLDKAKLKKTTLINLGNILTFTTRAGHSQTVEQPFFG
jgi:hypothetical protein